VATKEPVQPIGRKTLLYAYQQKKASGGKDLGTVLMTTVDCSFSTLSNSRNPF